MSQGRARCPSVVVLGCGNPSRGDDALGPALMRRLEAWIERHPGRPVTAVEDFQFQIEHALDLRGHDLALFVDASASGPEPLALHRLEPQADGTFTTHALSPQALLQAFAAIDQGPPPTAFALAVRGYSFDLGKPLSAGAAANLDRAWSLIQTMVKKPSQENWRALES